MNCKFIDTSRQPFDYIFDIDLTPLDKLFLCVDVVNGTHYVIDKQLLDALNSLDVSKIIVLGFPKQITPLTHFDKLYIPIMDWNVRLISLHSSFTLNNYNFIYTDNFKTITELYQKDKITIILCWYDVFKVLNDTRGHKQLHTFIDIIISSRPMRFNRRIETEYGIQKIVWTIPDKTHKTVDYFRLDGKTATLQY